MHLSVLGVALPGNQVKVKNKPNMDVRSRKKDQARSIQVIW
jgi:hypothetical protein